MSLKLTTRRKGGVDIVETSGKVTLGEGTSTLRKNIRELLDGGSRRIVLDMAAVNYMDSSGVGELLAAHTTVTSAGGEIMLLNVSPRVRQILKMTRIDSVFEIFDDEQLAVDSFSVAAGIVETDAVTSKNAERLLWALQIVTAAAFLLKAVPKLSGTPEMVALFQQIGMGQWLRYMTGALEATGALLLLIPGLAGPGALLLMAVTVGAVFTHVAKIGGSPAHAASYLLLAAIVAWFRRRQIVRGGSLTASTE
jgi:anti-sigma B factor antagonist